MNNNEPIILGKVKKGGSGKPIVVIIVFLFIGAIIFLLPTALNYFGDYNVIDLIKNGEIIDFFINHDSYMNGNISIKNNDVNNSTDINNNINYINNKTVIKENNFTLSDFILTNESISFKVSTSTPIDFDNQYYYLQLTKENKILSTIKIIGNIENEETISYTFKTKLDSIIEIIGNIKKYNDNDYPTYTLSSDESGLSSLTCILNNDIYEYTFDNNKLVRIKQNYNYIDKGNTNEYIKEFEEYIKLSNEINNSNNTSTIIENNTGFIFTADIDLTKYNKNINTNYYSYNTNSNKIKFDMDAKGYDCK